MNKSKIFDVIAASQESVGDDSPVYLILSETVRNNDTIEDVCGEILDYIEQLQRVFEALEVFL